MPLVLGENQEAAKQPGRQEVLESSAAGAFFGRTAVAQDVHEAWQEYRRRGSAA